jgi:hypothetical protein
MTDLVPELATLPIFATLDGELCAFGPGRSPDFPLICERMLMRRSGIRVTYMVFDLLSLNGHDLTSAPYSERRAQLEALDLNGVYWQTPEHLPTRSCCANCWRTQIRPGMSEQRCVGCSGSSMSGCHRSPKSRSPHQHPPSFATATETRASKR